MKKLLYVFLLFVNAFSAEVWDGSVATSFAGGTGTQDDPYQIANASQLAYMTTFMMQGDRYGDGNVTKGKYFVLTDDIIINDDTINYPNKWSSIGFDNNNSLYVFSGYFDGQGHRIIGFTSWNTGNNVTEAQFCNCGLFASVSYAKIRNVKMTSVYAKSYGFVAMSAFTTFENISLYGVFEDVCYPITSENGGMDTLIRIQTGGTCKAGGSGIMETLNKDIIQESFSTMAFGKGQPAAGLTSSINSTHINNYFLRVESDSLKDAFAADAVTIKNSYYANVSGARDNNVYFPSSSYLYLWAHLFYDSLSSVQLLNIPAGRRLNMKSRAAVDSLNSDLDSLAWAYDSCGINYGYPYLIHNPPYGKNTVCGSPSSSSAASGSSSSSAAESSSSEPPTAVYAGGQPRYSVSVIGSVIRVDNVRDVNVRLFDPLGNLIARKAVYGTGSVYFTVGGAGMYLLRIGGRTENVRVR